MILRYVSNDATFCSDFFYLRLGYMYEFQSEAIMYWQLIIRSSLLRESTFQRFTAHQTTVGSMSGKVRKSSIYYDNRTLYISG
jgi:hypothetical protein